MLPEQPRAAMEIEPFILTD